jgi:hypothetical protein
MRNTRSAARQNAGAVSHLSRHFPGFTRRVVLPGGGVPWTPAAPISTAAELSGLGFSLKPPQWLRTAVSQIVSGTKVSVPSVNIPLPGGGMITTPSTKPSMGQQAELLAANIPGGMVTIAAVGLLGAFLLLKRR